MVVKSVLERWKNAILTNIFETMNFNLISSNQAVGSLMADCGRQIIENSDH